MHLIFRRQLLPAGNKLHQAREQTRDAKSKTPNLIYLNGLMFGTYRLSNTPSLALIGKEM